MVALSGLWYFVSKLPLDISPLHLLLIFTLQIFTVKEKHLQIQRNFAVSPQDLKDRCSNEIASGKRSGHTVQK
jgi:hypothetical protein